MEMSYGAQAATEEDPKAKIQGKRFEALEALRALAALGITVFHYGCCFARLDYFIDVQKMSLHLLVDFFMVLGGFVFSHSYVFSAKACDPLKEVGHRVARMWPINVVAMVFAYIFAHPVGDFYANVDPVLWQLLMLNFYVANVSPNVPAWTMSCEFWVNAACALLVGQETPIPLLITASVLCHSAIALNTGSLATYCEIYFLHCYNGWPSPYRIVPIMLCNSGLLRVVASFLLGIVGYRLYRAVPEGWPGAAGAALTEAVLIAASMAMLFLRSSGRADFAAPWLWVLVIACFARESSWISQGLRWMAPLGKYAFSAYMGHWILLQALIDHKVNAMEGYAPIAIFGGLLALWSALAYHAVEDPCNRWLRREWDALLDSVRQRQRHQLPFAGGLPSPGPGQPALHAPQYWQLQSERSSYTGRVPTASVPQHAGFPEAAPLHHWQGDPAGGQLRAPGHEGSPLTRLLSCGGVCLPPQTQWAEQPPGGAWPQGAPPTPRTMRLFAPQPR